MVRKRKESPQDTAQRVFDLLSRRNLCWISAVGAQDWLDLADPVDAGVSTLNEDVSVEILPAVLNAIEEIAEDVVEDSIYAVLAGQNGSVMLRPGNDAKAQATSVEDLMVAVTSATRDGDVDECEYTTEVLPGDICSIVRVIDGHVQHPPAWVEIEPVAEDIDDEEDEEYVCNSCGWRGSADDAEVGEDSMECPECGDPVTEDKGE